MAHRSPLLGYSTKPWQARSGGVTPVCRMDAQLYAIKTKTRGHLPPLRFWTLDCTPGQANGGDARKILWDCMPGQANGGAARKIL